MVRTASFDLTDKWKHADYDDDGDDGGNGDDYRIDCGKYDSNKLDYHNDDIDDGYNITIIVRLKLYYLVL